MIKRISGSGKKDIYFLNTLYKRPEAMPQRFLGGRFFGADYTNDFFLGLGAGGSGGRLLIS